MADLTDEQCDAFRRLPGSFNDMVRAIYRAGMNAATPPADAALADLLARLDAGFGTAHGVREALSAYRKLCREAAAALRARAVPEGFSLVANSALSTARMALAHATTGHGELYREAYEKLLAASKSGEGK